MRKMRKIPFAVLRFVILRLGFPERKKRKIDCPALPSTSYRSCRASWSDDRVEPSAVATPSALRRNL